jgi:membrane protein DedA with SNARE-associated domain
MLKDIFQKIKLPLFIIIFFVTLILLWNLFNLPSEEQLTEMARGYFDKYGLITVFIASVIEGTLLAGWYAPGGLVIFLGVILSGDPKQAFLSVLCTIAGFMIAWTLNFFTGKFGWYKLLLKLGVKSSLEKAQEQFTKNGFKTIYLSYWEPNLASLISTSAGIAQVPIRKFLTVSLIATVFWCAFWGTSAYIFGTEILKYLGGIFFVAIIGWVIFITIKHIKQAKSTQSGDL